MHGIERMILRYTNEQGLYQTTLSRKVQEEKRQRKL